MESITSSINYMSYRGCVRITIKDKKNKTRTLWLHNTGTPALGQIICKSLVKGETGTLTDDRKPYKVNIIARGNKGVGTPLLARIAPITGGIYGPAEELPALLQAENEDILGFTKFTATIVKDSVLVLINPTGLQLVLQDQHNNVLAYIDDDQDHSLETMYDALRTQEVVIDWFLIIVNVSNV